MITIWLGHQHFCCCKVHPNPLWVNGQSWLIIWWRGLIDDFFTTLRICRYAIHATTLRTCDTLRRLCPGSSKMMCTCLQFSPWCLLSLSVGQIPAVTSSVGCFRSEVDLLQLEMDFAPEICKLNRSLRRNVKREHIWGWRTATSLSQLIYQALQPRLRV
jgi:hypothetical protein